MSNRAHTAPGDAVHAPGPRRDFDLHDANRDGRIALGEFMRLMENTETELSVEECQTAFDEIDTDQDGLIDYAQFQVWWNERVLPPESP